jgi:hypothetical protein
VIRADLGEGVVHINRGRRNKLPNGTRFIVWRTGKDNVRARMLKSLNPSVPIMEGMNISNPFYDPLRQLKVYIYGDLKQYPAEVVKRRLAASNVTVAARLDDTVNVVVLGEPPVAVVEDVEDEAEAEVAERRASLERDRRLNEILLRARAIGAVVVTQDRLRLLLFLE